MSFLANLLNRKPETLPHIVILTPVKDAADLAEDYFRRLLELTFPHRQISIGLLESDSRDGTYEAFHGPCERAAMYFRRARLWKRDFKFHLPKGVPRWGPGVQTQRRATLARSRNHLLFLALDDADWVLWLDVDVIEFPPDIIERLLAVDKDIAQPHCVKEYGGPSFDLNAWRDRGQKHMHDLRSGNELVELEAVGGSMLLVRADLHRDGLIFPPFYYGPHHPFARQDNGQGTKGEIESEGFGLMAADMNVKCWGLPRLEVRHRNA